MPGGARRTTRETTVVYLDGSKAAAVVPNPPPPSPHDWAGFELISRIIPPMMDDRIPRLARPAWWWRAFDLELDAIPGGATPTG